MKVENVRPPSIQSVQAFCREMGIAEITAWRFRKKGWLETTNISGRQYVTADQIMRFLRRAEAGEFASEHQVPGLNRVHGSVAA